MTPLMTIQHPLWNSQLFRAQNPNIKAQKEFVTRAEQVRAQCISTADTGLSRLEGTSADHPGHTPWQGRATWSR